MGSDFVSTVEASKMLRRSRRTVVEYLKNGLLRRDKQGKTVLIPREDVERLAVDLGTNLPPMNRQTFFQLTARIQRLEAAVAVLKKAAGITDSPMRPEKDDAIGLYTMARRAQTDKDWKSEEVLMWADLFEKMDEVFFDAVSIYTGDQEAWRPFYSLCAAQAQQIAYQEDFKTSLFLQQLHDRLCLSLKTMRGVVLAWIESGNGTAIDQALPEEALVRRLSAKTRKSLE